MSIVNATFIPEGLSLEGKIDFMINMMMTSERARTEDRKQIVKLEEDVKSLNKEVRELKTQLNIRDQQGRGKSLRLFGVPITPEEANSGPEAYKALSKRVYDIIKPMLTAAKTKGELDTVPQLNTAVEDCYRVGRFDQKTPPPIIINFTNRRVRMAVLRYKKLNTPSPSEDEKKSGAVKFSLVEDLTGPTYRKLKEIQQDVRVERAWTMDGSIRYTTSGDKSGAVRRVRSIYDSIDIIIASK